MKIILPISTTLFFLASSFLTIAEDEPKAEDKSYSEKLKEVYENFGFEPIFYFSIDPNIFYSQTIIVVIIALILSLYPIIKMMSLDPVTAMRN